MAKPAPKPQSNIVLFLLWSVTLFLGYKMFFDKPQDVRPAAELLATMRDQNRKLLDQSIARTHSAYDAKVDAEANIQKGALPKDAPRAQIAAIDAAAQGKKIESALLVADTQLRAGEQRDETARVRTAYNTLWGMDKHLHGNAQWNGNRVTTAGGVFTGQQLFDTTGDRLSGRNKHDKVWGFIPGGYGLIDGLVAATGRVSVFSYAFAALLLAFVVRLVVFPFSQKQLMHSRQMMQLSPLVAEIKEQYKDDPQQLNVRSMALYKEYGLNPVAGCAPALVQMPLFLTVYQCMLLYQFEFQKGTFLWINPTANAVSKGFFGANLGQLDPLLIVIYGASMIVSSLLTPVNDPAQRKQQRLIGVGAAVLFTVMMFTGLFPVVAGFVLYWTFTNIFSTLQSLRAYRLPLPPLKKVNAPSGGVFPMDAVRLGGKPAGRGKMAEAVVETKNGKTGKPAQHRPKKRSK